MLPQALKSCPKSNKLPNLVTLGAENVTVAKPLVENFQECVSFCDSGKIGSIEHSMFVFN